MRISDCEVRNGGKGLNRRLVAAYSAAAWPKLLRGLHSRGSRGRCGHTLTKRRWYGHAGVASDRVGSRTNLGVGFASRGQETPKIPSSGFAKPAQAE